VTPEGRLSSFSPLERILVFDDFDGGTHGWVELCGNYDARADLDVVDPHKRDMRPPQLSANAMSGTYALKVATRPLAGHTAVAIRRLTMASHGRVQFETYFAYGTEVGSDAAFGAFTVATDICDGVRYHTVARYLGTDLEHRPRQQWLYALVPEPTTLQRLRGRVSYTKTTDFTAPDPADWHPFGEPQQLGEQQWHYLRWLIDTRSRANVELQVDDRVFDMRDVPVPVYEESYGSLQELLNFYVSVRTHSDARNFLFLDAALISMDR
jgi:hypothetical protein